MTAETTCSAWGIADCSRRLEYGIGVDPERADELFEPFRRGDAGEGYDGTGIGLAIARKVVEQHGGRIWVEPRDGDGSRFCFTLPA